MRDDFSEAVKRTLAGRVGHKCSNPDCSRSTSGPGIESYKFVNIGVAAHITAADPGGPRYDPLLTQEERKSPENGIWLCQNCAHLIDTDRHRYSREVLSQWKLVAEARAHSIIRGETIPGQVGGGHASVVVLANQVDELAKYLADDIATKLEEMRSSWREGHPNLAFNWIKVLSQNQSKWEVLSAQLRAKLLRFEASLELDINGDVKRAKYLADQALEQDPADNQTRLRSLIAYKESGPDAALALLENDNDVDSRNLKGGLLLERDRIIECKSVLEFENGSFEPNAETYRIRALACLTAKNIGQARLEILKALELQPRWESVRFTAAMIDYFSALAVPALPGSVVLWPEPVEWAVVKRDDESRGHLQHAAEVFRALASNAEKSKHERNALETWCLASLMNDPAAQHEANKYCQKLLNSDPTHSGAIAWAVTRNLEVDLKPSEKALEELLDTHVAQIPSLLALASCYLASKKTGDAIKLLEQTKERFEKRNADDLWLFWYSQALSLNGTPHVALTTVDTFESAHPQRLPRIIALRGMAKQTGDWQNLLEYLEGSYQETNDPKLLLEICELKAHLQDWPYIADKAERLLAAIETPEVLRLGAIATFNSQRFQSSFTLLDGHRNLFPQAKLPNELRRLRVLCQQALGLLPQAVVDAEMLASDEPTTNNLTALAHIYIEKGDLKNLAIVARRLKGPSDLSDTDLLQFARLIHWEDKDLAIQFWRQSVQRSIPNKLLTHAISIGYLLGLDSELRPLLKRMYKLGRKKRGPVKLATTKDMIRIIREQREHGAQLDKAYSQGIAPIHVIAERANRPLVDFYHRLPEDNESAPEPATQPFLMARHGGRPVSLGFPPSAPKWRINLDISAVLLAEHLGITSDLEKVFEPIRISRCVIPALMEMRERMAAVQPSRLKAYREVIDLAERKTLVIMDCDLPDGYANTKLVEELGKEWVSLFEAARSTSGYLVDFFPLKTLDLTGPPTALPSNASNHFATCRAIINALQNQGLLSEEEYASAVVKLGHDAGQPLNVRVLCPGAGLFCEGNIPVVLADAAILGIVCKHFRVTIQRQELERLRSALHEQDRKDEIGSWLTRLINKLRDNIDAGTWEVISTPTISIHTKAKRQAAGLELQCLLDLLQFELQPGDVLWVDDRHVSSYSRRDQAAIVGIVEILKALVGAGVLSSNDYYDKLVTLRAANIRFIPVETDEILYHLNRAKVVENELVETQALAILRRYIAASLLRADVLQWPPMPIGSPNENGEIGFLIILGRSITNALVDLWKTANKDEASCMARSQWLVTNLWQEHVGLNHPGLQQKSKEDYEYLVGLRLTDPISQAIGLDFRPESGDRSTRQKYFDWLLKFVLRRRFQGNPNLPGTLAKNLEKTFFDRNKDATKESDRTVETILFQGFFQDLPSPVREEILRNNDFLVSIGLKPRATTYIEGLTFENSEFWRAIATAANGGECVVRSLVEKQEVKFQSATGRRGQVAIKFVHPITNKNVIFDDDSVSVALDSAAEREAALRRNKQWFDCSPDVLEQAVAKIVSIDNVERRIEELGFWRNSSASVYYSTLREQLINTRTFTSTDLLPPSVEGLLRYLRLSPSTAQERSFASILNESGLSLIRDEGLQTAIERFWGLPVPIPQAIVSAVRELSKLERRRLVKGLLKITASPISRVQLLAVLALCFDDSLIYRRLARWMVKALISLTRQPEFDGFKAILHWVSEEFGHWQEMRTLVPILRLALVWVHAHTLFGTLLSAGAPSDQIHERFSRMGDRLPHELFHRDLTYWFDIVHPRQVNRQTLLFSGLSYALGKDAKSLFDTQIHDALIAEAYELVENVKIPRLPLLKDPTLASDSLQSFLAADRGEIFLHLLGNEYASAFSRESLRTITQRAIEKLAQQPSEFDPWGQMFAIVGDMPPYEEAIERMRTILIQTEFCKLFEKDQQLIGCTMLAATTWAATIEDEQLRKYLKDQLVKICHRLSRSINGAGTEDKCTDTEQTAALLLESALNVSRSVRPPEQLLPEFSDLITQMLDAWPKMAHLFRPVVQRVCEELPIAAARHVYPLVLRLRAS